MCLSSHLHFITLHDLLNGISNVAHPHIDAGSLLEQSYQAALTCTPALVASLTASSNLSHVGSKFMVNAESHMRPFT